MQLRLETAGPTAMEQQQWTNLGEEEQEDKARVQVGKGRGWRLDWLDRM